MIRKSEILEIPEIPEILEFSRNSRNFIVRDSTKQFQLNTMISSNSYKVSSLSTIKFQLKLIENSFIVDWNFFTADWNFFIVEWNFFIVERNFLILTRI